MLRTITVVLALAVAPAAGATGYADLADRPVKALSPEQIDDLRNGRGMSLSLPAELNRHPGPAHVLEHAAALRLSPEQQAAVAAAKTKMSEQARRIGADIISAERGLEQAFATDRAEPAAVAAAAEAAGALWGRLRAVHLLAHIETTRLLTPAQIDAYDRLRGYPAEGRGHDYHTHQ